MCGVQAPPFITAIQAFPPCNELTKKVEVKYCKKTLVDTIPKLKNEWSNVGFGIICSDAKPARAGSGERPGAWARRRYWRPDTLCGGAGAVAGASTPGRQGGL